MTRAFLFNVNLRNLWITVFVGFVLFVVSLPASAAELTLSIVRASDGESAITVAKNTTVNYEIRGVLSDSTDNEGLAFWSANLEFLDDADIAHHGGIVTPSTSPMNQFVKDDGFTNLAGYGGTEVDGKLVQIGGGQNTIGNTATNAPYPVANPVTFNVAHTSQVLASGSYTVPASAGDGELHKLRLTACMASAIDNDDTDSPYGTHAIDVECGTAELVIGTPPEATLTAAVSRYANSGDPSGYCDLALTPAVRSEPRNSKIAEVRITFDTAPGNPTGGGSGTGVSIQEKTCPAPGTYAAYSGASTVSYDVSGNTLVVGFNPALENARTYELDLGSLITTIGSQSVEVRGLMGDVNDDGAVNATDRSVVVGVWTGATNFSCKTDLNSDGATNATDRSIVVGAWTGSQNCAP